MTVKVTELRDIITTQQFAMNRAIQHGMMVNQEKERMRNVLMNYLDDIVEALQIASEADKRVERLMAEVASADAELLDKDEEIAALKKEIESKTGARKAKKAETSVADDSVK